jgi:hypothetical protein
MHPDMSRLRVACEVLASCGAGATVSCHGLPFATSRPYLQGRARAGIPSPAVHQPDADQEPATMATPLLARRTGTVRVDGEWLQDQLDLRLLTLTAFAAEVPCDVATLRKALADGPINRRKASDILQALRRLPVEEGDIVDLLGVRQKTLP